MVLLYGLRESYLHTIVVISSAFNRGQELMCANRLISKVNSWEFIE